MSTDLENEYIAKLEKIIEPKNFLDKADLMPYCMDLVSSIVKKEDFLYYNDNLPKFAFEATKASLIYKMMFDFSNKSAFIFADGFHKHAFDKSYVIESFRNFVFKVFDNNSKNGEKEVPLVFVSKGRFENIDRNLRTSDFFNEVELLQNATSDENDVYSLFHHNFNSKLDEFLSIESVEEDGVEIGIKFVQNTDIENKKSVFQMNSFSVFDGTFYRVERDNGSEGEAYVNFGDIKGAQILSKFFDFLKNNSDNKNYKLKRADDEGIT